MHDIAKHDNTLINYNEYDKGEIKPAIFFFLIIFVVMGKKILVTKRQK